MTQCECVCAHACVSRSVIGYRPDDVMSCMCVCAGEVVKVEPSAGGGEALAPRQDSVREDGEHEKPSAVSCPGETHLYIYLRGLELQQTQF